MKAATGTESPGAAFSTVSSMKKENERNKKMVITYETPGAFLEEAQEALLKRESVSQLLLTNALYSPDRKCEKDFLFGTVWKEKRVQLAFCNCYPYNLCIHAIKKPKEAAEKENIADAVKELASYITEKKIPIRGLNANDMLCRDFFSVYEDAEHRTARKNLSMDIMECTSLKTAAFAEGIYRTASEEDKEWILKGCLAFEEEALHEKGDPVKIRESIETFQIGEKRLRLFCLLDGTRVCMANRARTLQNGFVINQVYTPPEYRAKGYAQTLIYKMCEEFFAEGYRFATLFVDKTNPVSNRVYAKVGFQIMEDSYEYKLKEPG